MVGENGVGMGCTAGFKLSGEVADGSAGGLDLLQVLALLVAAKVIFSGDEMHGHFFTTAFVTNHRFQKFYEVAHLIEEPDSRIKQVVDGINRIHGKGDTPTIIALKAEEGENAAIFTFSG